MNKNIFIKLDKVATGLLLACGVTFIILLFMEKDRFQSPIYSWCIGLTYVCFAINVIVTVMIGRKKNVDFWLKTALLVLVALLWIAEAAGVING